MDSAARPRAARADHRPAAPGPDRPERRPPSRGPPPSGDNGLMRILVVDDDRSLRDALRRALTLGDYEVALAEGGQEGLTKIATQAPDAVVLDIGMPDIDGLEVCRRLRSA